MLRVAYIILNFLVLLIIPSTVAHKNYKENAS